MTPFLAFVALAVLLSFWLSALGRADGLQRGLVVNAANTGDLVLLQPPDMTKGLPLCHIPHLRECLIDQLVECLALLSGANAAHDRLSHDVAVLVNHVGGRERVQVGGELSGLAI